MKLYVNDIEIFRKIKIERHFEELFILRGKKTDCSNVEILYKLMYHDIYILYSAIKNLNITKIKCNLSKYNLLINIFFKNKVINFTYNKNSNKRYHVINNINLTKKKNLVLNMFKDIFSNNVDFEENKKRSLYSINLINRIKKNF